MPNFSRTWISVLGVILLPLILVGALVGSVWQAGDRTHTVPAAIVNLDEPVTVEGQYVPLGRQFAGILSSLDKVPGAEEGDEANYDWTVTNEDEAAEGLREGKYSAVVTIPENFSAAATSTAGEAADAEQAVVDVSISPAARAVDPALANIVVQAALNALNTDLTQTFLDNVFVGFSSMAEQFATVAEASQDLAAGTSELSDGVAQTSTGVEALAEGAKELDDNGGTLVEGVEQYTGGVVSLAEGLEQLNAGVSQLPEQTQQLANGVEQTADGAAALAEGAEELATGASQLQQGIEQTAAGAAELAGGAEQTATGAEELGGAAGQVAEGAAGLTAGLQQYQQQMPAGLQKQLTCEVAGIPEGPACEGFKAGVKAASEQAAAGLGSASDTESPIGGAAALETGTAGIAAGLNGSGDQPGLAQGAGQLAAGAKQLAAGIKGSDDQPGLAQGAGQLAGGAQQLATGAGELATGAGQLASGTEQLAGAMPQLSDGVASAASGARTLADSGPQLTSGLEQYTQGVHQLSTGTAELATGVAQLADGAEQLDTGTQQLADGLAEGASSVPTYTDSEREQLTAVATRPVVTGQESGPVAFADPATLSAIAGIALWVATLLGSVLLGTGATRAWRSSASTWRLMLRSLAPVAGIAAGQGILFGALIAGLTSASAGDVAKLIVVGALAGAGFAALNQALALLFGRVGRFVSVAVTILAVATSLVTALPGFLAAIRPVLPTTQALDAITAVTGPMPGFGWAVAGLVAWLVIGLAGTMLGIHRRRQVRMDLALAPA